jgi:hypothetical protein
MAGPPLATDATSQVGVVAYGATTDMQRRIVDRIEPKTLFPFGASPCMRHHPFGTVSDCTGSRFWFSPSGLKYMGNRAGLILGAVQSGTALFSCVLPSWVAKW